MSRLMRSSVMKLALAVVLVALGVGGTLVAIEGTSSAATAPPKVDHQLCYVASATGFKPPPAGSVRLIDQFTGNGIVPTKISPLALNCNPVQKTVVTPAGGRVVTPITNPSAHLACFPIVAPTQPTETVSVTNQFGTGTLVVGQPKLLCLPTWKSLTGPPQEPVNQPPNLNHFTCYSVSFAAGTTDTYREPGTVSLTDEFGTSNKVTIGAPTLLCLPTEKQITTSTGVKTYPIINAAKHLLCFPVSKTPIKSPVYDLNQFGRSTVTIKLTSLLCLPSSKKVLQTGT